MSHSIGQDFRFRSLLQFTLPTIVMMVFLSLYSIVDGVFIARFLGSNSLSAQNIVWPVGSLELALGIMLASGGSAVVARKLGEGSREEARRDYTFLVLAAIVTSLLIMLLGNLFLEPVCRMLGATDLLLQDAKDYLQVMLYFAPAQMLQCMFQFHLRQQPFRISISFRSARSTESPLRTAVRKRFPLQYSGKKTCVKSISRSYGINTNTIRRRNLTNILSITDPSPAASVL